MLFVGSRQEREREREREGDRDEEEELRGRSEERVQTREVIYENRGGIIIFLSPAPRPFRTSPVDGTLANNKKDRQRALLLLRRSGAEVPPPRSRLASLAVAECIVRRRWLGKCPIWEEGTLLHGKSFRPRAGKSGETARREVERSPCGARCWGFLGAFGENFRPSLNNGRTVAGPRESQVSATRHRIYDARFPGKWGVGEEGNEGAIRCGTRLNGGEGVGG